MTVYRYPKGSVGKRTSPTTRATTKRSRGGLIKGPHDTLRDLCVRALALRGWLAYYTHTSRHSPAGFPDICAVHPARGRIIFIEVKTGRGALRAAQRVWRDALRDAKLPWYELRENGLADLLRKVDAL